ncbi:MAG: DUF3572 domain-containing protein [Pseudomonadota bacterium]
MQTSNNMGPEAAAQALAIDALGHLATDPESLGRFLALAGIGPENLRTAASEPGFLAGLLDFLLNDESRLLAFCENRGHEPTAVATAREILGGPAPQV